MMTLMMLVSLCPIAAWGLQAGVRSTEETTVNRKTVWIYSFMRSGSSTVLDMMSAHPDHTNRDGGTVFSLFEPCHNGDKYGGKLAKLMDEDISHCADLALDVSRCDFGQIENLDFWKDRRTTNANTDHYSKGLARKKCEEASLIAIKTVQPFLLENATWVLDQNPHMKIIELIRDPR